MMLMQTPAPSVDLLRQRFGDAVQENILLAPYTSARIGGVADVLVMVKIVGESRATLPDSLTSGTLDFVLVSTQSWAE